MASSRLPKSRPTKRPMAKFNYSTGGGTLTATSVPGRIPKLDEKGYPTQLGAPDPTLVEVTVVA